MKLGLIPIAERLCRWPVLRPLVGPEHDRSPLLPAAIAVTLVLAGIDAVVVLLFLVAPSFFLMRVVYDVNTVILPAVLGPMAAVGFIVWNRRPYERGVLRVAALFAVAAAGLFTLRIYATHIEPYRLQIHRVTIQTPKLLHPVRILHISDIQAPRVGAYEEAVFARILELAPDLVIFTGDLLQPIPPADINVETQKMASLLATLAPSNGILGIRGDVDEHLANSPSDLGGMRWLDNESVCLDTGVGTIRVLGLTRAAARNGLGGQYVRDWFPDASNDFTIVIAHPPDFILHMSDLPVDLCLAGHTHGGQIRLPFLGPILTLSAIPRRLASGFHEVGRTRLNVSAGVGCEHTSGLPALRIFCPPEMTLIELVPAPKPAPVIARKETP